MATVVFGDYEWDADKAATNLEKHRVSFFEAAAALQDPHAVYLDASTATQERFAAIGLSAGARLLYIVHVERRERDRIISARLATAVEYGQVMPCPAPRKPRLKRCLSSTLHAPRSCGVVRVLGAL